MYKRIVLGWLALAAFLPLAFLTNTAHAQHSTSMAELVRIDGFDVEPVRQPAAGNELVFTLYGSPGGTATVQINGATGSLPLVETEPGVYEGTYTIRKRDKIVPASTATANLRLNNRVASAILDEPLIGRANARRTTAAMNSAAAPKIDRFDVVDPPPSLVPGEDLILTMSGSPGGVASARIGGVKGKVVLDEIRGGVYEGAYIIKNRDRIAANSVVTGHLRIGERETNAVLGQSLVAAGSRAPSSAPQARRGCANCGVVQAVNTIEVKGQGTYLGAVVGGVAGVLLGSQVGHGAGTTVAEVAGGAGGAYAGNEIEKRMRTTKHYEVVVRLDNGGSHTISYATQPAFPVGTRVKVTNGALTAI